MLVLVLLALALPLGLWIASAKYARRHERRGDWDAEGPRHPSGPRWRGPAAIGALLGGQAFVAMHGEPGEIPAPESDVPIDDAALVEGSSTVGTPADDVDGVRDVVDDGEIDLDDDDEDDEDADAGQGLR